MIGTMLTVLMAVPTMTRALFFAGTVISIIITILIVMASVTMTGIITPMATRSKAWSSLFATQQSVL